MSKKKRIKGLESKNMQLSIECDELQAALGECQAGREAYGRVIEKWQDKYDARSDECIKAWQESIGLKKENAELRAQLDTIHEHTVDFVTAFQPLVGTLLEYQETENERMANGE